MFYQNNYTFTRETVRRTKIKKKVALRMKQTPAKTVVPGPTTALGSRCRGAILYTDTVVIDSLQVSHRQLGLLMAAGIHPRASGFADSRSPLQSRASSMKPSSHAN